MSFLGARCDKPFLVEVLKARPDILEWAAKVNLVGLGLSGKLLVAAMASWDLLPEGVRIGIVANVKEHSLTWLDAKPLTDTILRQVFKEDEFEKYTEAFRKEWLSDIPNVFEEFGRYSSDNEVGLYEGFKEDLQIAQVYFGLKNDSDFDQLYARIDSHIETLQADQPQSVWSPLSMDRAAGASNGAGAIFDDVDA
jgi:hypothetical protein